MAHIRALPPVPLQEPDSFQIAHLCPAPGSGLSTCKYKISVHFHVRIHSVLVLMD